MKHSPLEAKDCFSSLDFFHPETKTHYYFDDSLAMSLFNCRTRALAQ